MKRLVQRNLEKEQKCYKWKVDKDGDIIDGVAVKFNDHLQDAKRYARYTHSLGQPSIKMAFSE